MTVFSGVPIDSIGTLYHTAIGYDDGAGNVVMVGYVCAAGTDWDQGTNVQDEGQLIAVASPNQIDRNLGNWPKVTQGDWTKGEQQQTYIDPQRYRISDGAVDTSRPGGLQLFPSPRTTSYVLTGTSNKIPIVALGDEWFAGVKTSTFNLVTTASGSPVGVAIGDGTEILDIMLDPFGVVIATGTGIWQISGTPTATLFCTEGVAADVPPVSGCVKSMAYFDEKLYFISVDQTQIKYVVDGNTTPVVYRTFGTPGFEQNLRLICSTANGLFYVTYKIGSEWVMTFYISDGGAGPDTRVAEVIGKVIWAEEIYGVTYILMRQFQQAGHNDFTLYSLQGTQLDKVIDMRWVQDEFREVGSVIATTTADVQGNIWGDGRFLYVGWPGLPGLRIDLTPGLGAFPARCTAFNPLASKAHRVFSSDADGILDANVYTVGGVLTATINEYSQAPTTGSITLSDFDFDTPGENKAFRGVFIELDAPLPGGASVAVTYAVDGSLTYLSTVQIINSTTRMTYRIPRGTSGRRISVKLALTGAVVIRSVAVEGTLGRVWKATLQCNAQQQLLDSSFDNQGQNSQQLLGNIESAFESAARAVYAYVPSLTNPDQVEMVQATLETYNWRTPRPGSSEGGNLEGNIDVTLKEVS
jgi:hypothetical protein